MTLSSTSSSARRCASVTDPPARRASRPPWIAYRHETTSPENASSGAPKERRLAPPSSVRRPPSFVQRARTTSASDPVDRLPVRDAEPAGTRFGALDDRLGGEHALRRLETSGVEHALSRVPALEHERLRCQRRSDLRSRLSHPLSDTHKLSHPHGLSYRVAGKDEDVETRRVEAYHAVSSEGDAVSARERLQLGQCCIYAV